MQKLPIGIQTFSEIREDNHLYVDKTAHILNLFESGKYYFLSRPRRFGKSLFISTLQAVFEGRRELFTGLYIHDQWDWETTYPVIKLSFAGVARTVGDMKEDIFNILKNNEERLHITCPERHDIGGCLQTLIEGAARKYQQKVVILVDEYDKLILDNLDQIEMAEEAREILKDLYTTIKGCDEFIKFAFLTGVSKFAKVSIFSGLNNLEDISLDKKYGAICGYTENDLKTVFARRLQGADMDKVREWYNGFNFLGEHVYNPYDILLFIKNDFLFKNYWFATGTPTFLIKLIKENDYYLPALTDLWLNDAAMESFDIENIKLEPILFQAGYMTIKEVRELPFGGYEYRLNTPNKEVAISLHDAIIQYLTNETRFTRTKSSLYQALDKGDLNLFADTLKSLFTSIPYNNYVNNTISSYEGYFASVLYVYLASLGLEIIGEDVTNRGRIDLTLKLGENIYILEFKVDGDGREKGSGIKQIKEKNYPQKYLHEGKNIYLIGIDFSAEEKNITDFAYEKLQAQEPR